MEIRSWTRSFTRCIFQRTKSGTWFSSCVRSQLG